MLPVQQCLTFFYFANIVSIHLQRCNNKYGKVEVMQGVLGLLGVVCIYILRTYHRLHTLQ
jgi:hypothetical protein